jgi:hypothetical protein
MHFHYDASLSMLVVTQKGIHSVRNNAYIDNFHGYRNGSDTGCTAMAGNGVLYLVRMEVIKDSGFVNSRDSQRELESASY